MLFRTNRLWWIALGAGLIPLLWLFVDLAIGHLGSNPIQSLNIRLGDWSLRFLILTLAVTPVQTVTQWHGMTDFRQLFGLYAFFYASLHVFVYLLVDHALIWPMIFTDIIESPYIWFGILAYIVLFLLAISSPKWAKKQLGKNWKKLHRFIYMGSGASLIHYFWQLKGNLAEPLFYLLLLFLLLGFRVLIRFKNRQFALMMIPKSRQ